VKVDSINAVRPASRFPDTDTKDKAKPEAAKEAKDVVESKNKSTPNETISIGEQHLIEAIENANKALKGADKRFEFSIHEGTKEIMVKVINDETDEIIREIPPEKILDMVAKMWEMAGLLVDRKI
jgi:flagellar protein FlaG